MTDLVEAIARLSKNGRIRSAWLPGMLVGGVRIDGVDHDGRPYRQIEFGRARPIDRGLDLTDPATAGCLLALLREAYRSPTAHVVPQAPDEWIVWVSVDDGGWENVASGRTEVEAVVGALVAAAEEA